MEMEQREAIAGWLETGFEAETVQPLTKLKELEQFDVFFNEQSGTLRYLEHERTILLMTPEQVREHSKKYKLDTETADWRGVVGHELAEGLARLLKADEHLDDYLWSGNEISRFDASVEALRGTLLPERPAYS